MFKKADKKCTYEKIIKDSENLTQPNIFFTNEVLNQFKAYADICDKEIGWLAFVDKKDDNYIVYDTILPEQKVSATTTDLSEESLNDIAFELMKTRPDDFDKVKCWCHSHVNMDVFASGTDDETFEQFYKPCDFFIRVIVNKKGLMKVDFVDTIDEIRFDNVDWNIYNDNENIKKINERISELEDEYDRLTKKIAVIRNQEYEMVKAKLKPLVDEKVKSSFDYTVYRKSEIPYQGYYDNGRYYGWYDWDEEEEKEKKQEKEDEAYHEFEQNVEDAVDMLYNYYYCQWLTSEDIYAMTKENSNLAVKYSEEFGIPLAAFKEAVNVFVSDMEENYDY